MRIIMIGVAVFAVLSSAEQNATRVEKQVPPPPTPRTTKDAPINAEKGVTTPPKLTREGPAEWLHRVTGIDLRAYATITAVRQESSIEPAPHLMHFDRRTGEENLLWKCSACWSPARVTGGTAVLRQAPSDPAGAELWVVRDGSNEPVHIAALSDAAAIAGVSGQYVYVGVRRQRCASSSEGPYGIVSVALTDGAVAEVLDAPCFGPVGLTSSGRILGDSYLASTRKNDLSGIPRPRSLLVISPATAQTPTAQPFDKRLTAPPDRYDAVWIDEHSIVYLSKP